MTDVKINRVGDAKTCMIRTHAQKISAISKANATNTFLRSSVMIMIHVLPLIAVKVVLAQAIPILVSTMGIPVQTTSVMGTGHVCGLSMTLGAVVALIHIAVARL
jgi:hypothetical protein